MNRKLLLQVATGLAIIGWLLLIAQSADRPLLLAIQATGLAVCIYLLAKQWRL